MALIAAQDALYGYIFALTGKREDTRDLLQSVNLKICRQLDKYDPSRPFLPWARKIAYFEVLSYRNHSTRDRLVLVDNTFFDSLAVAAESAFDATESDLVYLEECLQKLPSRTRALVEGHYFQRIAVKKLAEQYHYAANSVSVLLAKARQALAKCITAARLREGHS